MRGTNQLEKNTMTKPVLRCPSGKTHRNRAKAEKDNEWYTQRSDVEQELSEYREQLRGKRVYHNADGLESEFWQYSLRNYESLGLQRVDATEYSSKGSGRHHTHIAGTTETKMLRDNGGYQTDEAVAILRQSDVVITNPPFKPDGASYGEYIRLLIDEGKQFLVMGHVDQINSNAIWEMIMAGQGWPGVNNRAKKFDRPDGSKEGQAAMWYTNMEHGKRREMHRYRARYAKTPEAYPRYVNYPQAIEVSAKADIPRDWNGEMGVPITYMLDHNPDEFEIIGRDSDVLKKTNNRGKYRSRMYTPSKDPSKPDGDRKSGRIIIRRRKRQ